ncbi:hypothetical protein TTHERM_00411580 (macronuclear) [Tetrahymena thermophila SB210]|uniref:Uncharacterized protein n=1 Tax=Tetrahymena thermophila (strain SB210) TaxID=312017 RepID=I7M931_TETTS|nr:hypothetical protein TTHERM_00411580 [Tetrahymena thermophila SB210]EAS00607.2 hypothetical protein TTHERM_00411580 [Tetrahymena thermophila SB210]|eukprot:XP_001020852.2 hypothetical protein TTHERM_00411580 [Tetrahymena thermophila SB210]
MNYFCGSTRDSSNIERLSQKEQFYSGISNNQQQNQTQQNQLNGYNMSFYQQDQGQKKERSQSEIVVRNFDTALSYEYQMSQKDKTDEAYPNKMANRSSSASSNSFLFNQHGHKYSFNSDFISDEKYFENQVKRSSNNQALTISNNQSQVLLIQTESNIKDFEIKNIKEKILEENNSDNNSSYVHKYKEPNYSSAKKQIEQLNEHVRTLEKQNQLLQSTNRNQSSTSLDVKNYQLESHSNFISPNSKQDRFVNDILYENKQLSISIKQLEDKIQNYRYIDIKYNQLQTKVVLLANQLEQTSQFLEQRGFESQELKQKYFKLEQDYINLQKTLYSLKGQNTQGRSIQDVFEEQVKQYQSVEKQNLQYKIQIRELEELSLKQQEQLTQLQQKYNNQEQTQQINLKFLKDENSSLKVKLQEEQQQKELLRNIQDNKQVPLLKQQAQQMIDQITKLSDQLKVKDQDLIKAKNNLLEIQYSQQNENIQLKQKLQESELNLQYWKTKCADTEAEKNMWISQYNQSVLNQIAQDKKIQDSKIEIDNQHKEYLKVQIDEQKKEVDSLKILNSNLQLENKILSEQINQLKESVTSFQYKSQFKDQYLEQNQQSNLEAQIQQLKSDLQTKETKVKQLQQYLGSLIRDLEQLNQIVRQENQEKLSKSNIEEQLNLEQGRNEILRKHCQELELKIKTTQNNLGSNQSIESTEDTEKVKRNKKQKQNKQVELDNNSNTVRSNSKNEEIQKYIQQQDQINNLEKQILQLQIYESQDQQNQIRIKELNEKINQLQLQNLELEDKIKLKSKVDTMLSANQNQNQEDEKKMIDLLVQIEELNKIINSQNSKEQQLIEENSLLKSQLKTLQDLQIQNEELVKFQKNYIKEKQIIEDRLKDLDQVIEKNNSQYKNKIEEQRITIKNLEKRIDLFKSQSVNNIKDKTNFEQDFYSIQNINAEYSQQVQKLKNELEVLQVKYKQLQVDNSQLKVQSEQQNKVYSQNKKEFGELQFQLNQANSKVLLLENQIKQKIVADNDNEKQSDTIKGNDYFSSELIKLQAEFKNQDKKLEIEKNQNLILQNNIINLQKIINQKQQELKNEKEESNTKFNLLEQNVNGLIQQNQSLKQQISEKTQSLQVLQNNYDQATKKLKEKEKNKALALSFGNNELRMQQIEIELNEKNNLLQNKDLQIKKLMQVQELYEKQQNQLNQLIQDSACLQQELSRSKEEFNKKVQEQIDLESQIFNYKEQIFKLELQLKKYQSNLNVDNISSASNTLQDQNDQRSQDLLNQIQRINSQNMQLKQSLDLVIEQNNKLADEVLLQKNQMNSMNQQILQYQQTISQLEDEQNEKTKKSKKIDMHSNNLELQIRELEDQIRSKDLLVNSIQLELDNYRITSSQKLSSIQNQVDEKTKKVEKLEQIYQESEKNFQKHLVELSKKDQAIKNLQIQMSALESKNLHVVNDLNLIQQREATLNTQVKQLVQENSQLRAQKIISDASQMNLSALIKENQILKEQHLTKIALIKYQVKNLFNHELKQSIEKVKQISLQKEQQLHATIQILQQQLQEEKSKYESLQTTYTSRNKKSQEHINADELKQNQIIISNKYQSTDLILDPQQIFSTLSQVVNDNTSLKKFIEEMSVKILQMQETLHNSLELLWKEQNVFMSCNLDTQEEQTNSSIQHHQIEKQVKQIIQNLNQLKMHKDEQNVSSGNLNYQDSSSLPISLQAINKQQEDDGNNQSCLLKQITQFTQYTQQELENVVQQIEFLEKQNKLLKNQLQNTQKENNKLLIELKVVKEQYINTKYSTILHSSIMKQEGEQSQELKEQNQNILQQLSNTNISEEQKIVYLMMQNKQLIEMIKTFQINEAKRSEQLNSSNIQLYMALKDIANFKSKNFNFETKIPFFESEQSII